MYDYLAKLVAVIPVTSAAGVERDFSQMNVIINDLRNRLGEKHCRALRHDRKDQRATT